MSTDKYGDVCAFETVEKDLVMMYNYENICQMLRVKNGNYGESVISAYNIIPVTIGIYLREF